MVKTMNTGFLRTWPKKITKEINLRKRIEYRFISSIILTGTETNMFADGLSVALQLAFHLAVGWEK